MIKNGQRQKQFKWVNLRFRRALAGMLIVFLMFPVNLPIAMAQQATSEQNQSIGVAADMGLDFEEAASSEGEGEIEEPAPDENPDEITEPAPEDDNPEDEPPSNIPPVQDDSNDDADLQIPDITVPAEEAPQADVEEDAPEIQPTQETSASSDELSRNEEPETPQIINDRQIETEDQASVTVPRTSVIMIDEPTGDKDLQTNICGTHSGSLKSTDTSGVIDKNLYPYGDSVFLRGDGFDYTGTVYYSVDTVPPSALPGWPILGTVQSIDLGSGNMGFDEEIVLTPAQYAGVVGVGGSAVVFKARVFSDAARSCNISQDNWKVEGEVEDPTLEITKTTNDTTVTLGEKVDYNIHVANTGNVELQNVEVTDDLPAGLEFFSTDHTLHSSSSTSTGHLVWELGDLAVNASETVKVTATTTGSGQIINTAVADSDDTDPPVQDDATVFVAKYELVIGKSANATTVTVGDTFTYDIVVANVGNDDQSNVVVTDALPAELEFVSSTPGVHSSSTTSTGNLIWHLGTVSPSQQLIQVTVKAISTSTSGSVTNTAVIESDQAGPESDDATVFVAKYELEIDKSANETTVSIGDQFDYEIVVSNTGNVPLTNVVTTDTIPAELAFVSSTPGVHSSSNTSTGNLIWHLGTIAPLSSETITVKVEAIGINPQGGLVTNVAQAGADQTSPKADDATVFVAKHELEIDKSTNDTTVTVGDTVKYLIVVTNTGNVDMSWSMVQDDLPAGLTFVSAVPTEDATNPLTWYTGPIAKGASETITVTAIANDVGVWVNTADGWSDREVKVSDDATTTVLAPKPGISITKVDSVDPVMIGKNTVYTINVKNTGDITLTQVELTDNLPTAFDFESSSIAPDVAKSLWKLGTLAPGEEREITVTAKANESGTFTNVAEVDAVELAQPAQATEPTKVVKTPVVAADVFKMKITKTDNVDPATVGDTVTYTVTVKNTGNTSLTGLVFSDTLPKALEFKSSDVSLSQTGEGLLAWNVNKLDPGKSRTFKIKTAAKEAGSWTNVVSVKATELPSGEIAEEQTEIIAQAVEASEEPVAESLPQTGFPTTMWWLAAITLILAGLGWELRDKKKKNLRASNWHQLKKE